MAPQHKNNSNSLQGHKARKRFGQNFLIDEDIIRDIVTGLGPNEADFVIEIGPGLGAITQLIAESGCQLQLIELDRDLIARLTEAFKAQIHNQKLWILNQDILQVDLSQLIQARTQPDKPGRHQAKLIGNLPYNISSPVLFHVLEHLSFISEMTFMLQKEVVDRLSASPSTSAYSALSVIIQFHCEVEKILDVPPESFNPPPKVASAVVKLIPKDLNTAYPNLDWHNFDVLKFRSFVHKCYQQRRKTLKNNLKEIMDYDTIQSLNIDPKRRPETLSVAECVTLFERSNSIEL